MGNACCKLSGADRYAGAAADTSGGYLDGRGAGGGYALPPVHAGEGVSDLCSGGPGIVITGGQDGSAAMWRWAGEKKGTVLHRWDAHPKPVGPRRHYSCSPRHSVPCTSTNEG